MKFHGRPCSSTAIDGASGFRDGSGRTFSPQRLPQPPPSSFRNSETYRAVATIAYIFCITQSKRAELGGIFLRGGFCRSSKGNEKARAERNSVLRRVAEMKTPVSAVGRLRRPASFSKKLDNHIAAVALYVAPSRTTPTKALGVADRTWSIAQFIDAALAVAPAMPTETPPDGRRKFTTQVAAIVYGQPRRSSWFTGKFLPQC
jgi:hypothetical protein